MNITPTTVQFGDIVAAHVRPVGPVTGTAPIIFLPGAWGGKYQFEKWQQYAADQGFESYAIDFPCHNESACNEDLGHISIEEYAQDVERMLAQTGPAYLVGHSMGGLIAQVVASRNPNVKKAAFAATTPPAGILVVNAFSVALLKYMPKIFTGQPVSLTREDATHYMMHRLPADAYDALVPDSGRAMADVVLARVKIDSIPVPTFVLAGAEDRSVPVSVEKQIAQKYGSQFEKMDGMAHYLMMEDGWEWPIGRIVEWLGN